MLRGGEEEDEKKYWKTLRKTRKAMMMGTAAPPKHVHCNDWREMLALTVNSISTTNAQVAASSPTLVQHYSNEYAKICN
ncbi:unnamed protein product [Toxocara canis]|uniref:Ovule protein n=1 Tax=Toxocara canis TaxID=6265 RepID=A0A183U6E7_TOXCA|nr:unnamed protein product [Toxocara canis]